MLKKTGGIIGVLILLGLIFSSSYKKSPQLYYADLIYINELISHVKKLSSKKMEGRETGTRGAQKAADYLTGILKKYGLEPMKDDYYQSFEIIMPNKPDVTISTDVNEYHLGEDFLSFFPHDSLYFTDDHIVYVGYGVDDPSFNDYAYLDVKNKIVLVKAGEPRDDFGAYILTGTNRPSEWSADPIQAYIKKRNAALSHGAKAMFYFDEGNYGFYKKIFDQIYESRKPVTGVKADSLYDFIISTRVLEDLTGYNSLRDVYYSGRKDRKWPVPVTIDYKTQTKPVLAKNIMAYVEGDTKPDEYVLVIANYDHLGKIDTVVFPGANNNATGTAALLEMANAFNLAANEGYRLKRSLLFVWFTGREKDHIGAKHFLEFPPVPLEKIKTVVDLDALGYVDSLAKNPNYVFVTGDFPYKSVEKKVEKFNKKGPEIELLYRPMKDHFTNRDNFSDVVMFINKKIPFVTYYAPGYPYNKTPRDTYHEVTFDVLHRRTQYIFLNIWEIANQ